VASVDLCQRHVITYKELEHHLIGYLMRKRGESHTILSQFVGINIYGINGTVGNNPGRDHIVLTTFTDCAGTS